MKFEKLNDVKIKVILTLKDMESNHISAESIISNSEEAQELIESIIEKAESELGFKPGDSNLLVEAIMPTPAECEFTITKVYTQKTDINNNYNSFIFKFDSFDNFVYLCAFLKNFPHLDLKDFSKIFSLIIYKNTYYLKALDVKIFSIILDYMKPFFTEFGQDLSNSIEIDGILNEYGEEIFAKDAIIKCLKKF